MIIDQPKPLFVDIETSLIPFYAFRPGKQYLTHSQMIKTSITDIICITYCYEKGKGHALTYDVSKGEDSSKIISEFDDIVRSGNYYIVGQNSDTFDVKHINTLRLMHGLDPFPEWADLSDDTLKQVRKYFKFPTNRLDFTSKLFGLGGKTKMEFDHWRDIAEYFVMLKIIRASGRKAARQVAPIIYDHTLDIILKKGKKSYDRMCSYGIKDVVDTRAYFNKIKPYIKPKVNMATMHGDLRCTACGSPDIVKNGTRAFGSTVYQQFQCKNHGGKARGYAGRAAINVKTGQVTGKMMGR